MLNFKLRIAWVHDSVILRIFQTLKERNLRLIHIEFCFRSIKYFFTKTTFHNGLFNPKFYRKNRLTILQDVLGICTKQFVNSMKSFFLSKNDVNLQQFACVLLNTKYIFIKFLNILNKFTKLHTLYLNWFTMI